MMTIAEYVLIGLGGVVYIYILVRIICRAIYRSADERGKKKVNE